MALNQSDVFAGLAEIITDIAGVPAEEIRPEKSFVDELDVDSLAMVEIIVAIEERFGVTVPDDEAKNLKTVGDVVGFIVPQRV